MENKMRVLLGVVTISMTAGCSGGRLVGIPTTVAGYHPVQARDVAPVGLQDVNVEVTTKLGPMVPYETCDGIITFPLPETMPQLANADAVELMGKANLVLTIPRNRYAEVRYLRSNDLVRVRGYISNDHYAEGCGAFGFGVDAARRYLRIDSIQRLEPAAPAVGLKRARPDGPRCAARVDEPVQQCCLRIE